MEHRGERFMDPAPRLPEPAVTLVTALAESRDLSDEAYRAIYDQVAEGRSLRNIELALRSGVSFGWWGKYANGERALDRARKNELRAFAGLPSLPPSVGEAVAAHVHADAAVYCVGEQVASRVVLIGTDVAGVNLRVNGDCRLLGGNSPQDAPQAACNGRYSRQARGTIHLDRAAWERLAAARVRAGVSWEEFLAPLVDPVQKRDCKILQSAVG